MVDRPDLYFGLENAEAVLDVGERLVARDDVFWHEIRGIGDEQQFAIPA